jgi:hypothetical protein
LSAFLSNVSGLGHILHFMKMADSEHFRTD